MKRNATALRAFTHANDSFDDKQTILGMDAGQFNDWRDAGLVREATDAEVARAKGEPAAKPKPATKRGKKAAPAPAPAPEPTPVVTDTVVTDA